MFRRTTTPRSDWKEKVEAEGFLFHTTDLGSAYWDESAYYEFTAKEVDQIEVATNELHGICLSAVQNVIDNNRYRELHIPDFAIPIIEASWNQELPSIYGRFDLRFDGCSPPKMLEFNADTPTSLLEASVIQWSWMKEKFDADQFNSIHDRLVAKWKELKDYLKPGELYFTGCRNLEDYITVSYLRETAHQAGISTKEISIEEIGWHSVDQKFLDKEMLDINNLFKLYPWEWLLNEEFGKNIPVSFESTFWIEPPWKLILSNKGILPILWELNPGHPNLLLAYFDQHGMQKFVKKPIYSREGANITIFDGEKESFKTDGEYGEEGFVFQELCSLPNFEDHFPVIGSWVVNCEAAGMGIRESIDLITGNRSSFVPHIFR